MARDLWFETVAVAQERAKKRLPKGVYSALLAGSEKGVTYSDNVEAFGGLLTVAPGEGDVAADYLEAFLDIIDVDGDLEMDVENDRAMVAIVGENLDDISEFRPLIAGGGQEKGHRGGTGQR